MSFSTLIVLLLDVFEDTPALYSDSSTNAHKHFNGRLVFVAFEQAYVLPANARISGNFLLSESSVESGLLELFS